MSEQDLFNLEDTHSVIELCKTPREKRDDAWMDRFLTSIPHASMTCGDPQVAVGPDGYPYFNLYFPPVGQSFEPYSVEHLLDFLCEHGFGVAVNPSGDNSVEWVFSFGDIWNYRKTGSFYGEMPEPVSSAEAGADAAREVLVGQPSEELLPTEIREVIAEALAVHFSVSDPSAFLLVDSKLSPDTNLVFNVFEEDFEDKALYEHTMRYISWALPRHYGLVTIAKDTDLSGNFVLLPRRSPSLEE